MMDNESLLFNGRFLMWRKGSLVCTEDLRKEIEDWDNRRPVIMPTHHEVGVYRVGPMPRYEPPLEDTP